MANQALDPKAVGTGSTGNNNNLIIRLLVALGILALVIVTAISLRNEPVVLDSTPAKVAIEQTFSTQQYWDKAAEYEAAKAAAATAVESPVTYTQQYWDKAAEYEAAKAAVATAVESPVTYTQQYWDKAAEYEAAKAAERQAAIDAALAEEPEWAYYTERYWSKTR